MPSKEDLLRQAINQHAAHRQVKDTAPERELVAKAKVAAEPQQYGLISTIARQGLQGIGQEFTDEGVAAARAGVDWVRGKGYNYDQRLGEERQMLKDMEAQHPTASSLAKIGGYIASPVNLAPGGGLVAGALKTGAQAALSGFGAGEGGVEERAGKAVREGIGGAVTSAAFGSVGKGLAKTFSKDSAGRAATRALGGTGSQYQDFKQLPGGPEGVGKKLLSTGLVTAKDTVYTVAEKVKQAKAQAGDEIGKLASEADRLVGSGKIPSLNVVSVMNRAYRAVEDLLENNANSKQVREAVLPRIQAYYDEYLTPALKSGNNQLKFSDLHAFQASMATAYEGADSVTKQALKALEKGLSTQLERGFKDAAKGGMGELFTKYAGAKQQYRFLAMAQEAAEQGVKKADSRTINQLEQAAAGTGVIGSLVYGNLPAAAAFAAAPFARKEVMNRGGNVLASMLNKGADLVGKGAQHAPAAQQAGRATLLETLRQIGGK
jgi:hypothetical protein